MERGQPPSKVLAPLRAAPVNRGHSDFRKGPLALLIGIIVANTAFGIFGCHAGPFVHPAVVGEVRLAEGVVIANGSPIDELPVFRFHELDLFRREYGTAYSHFPRQFDSGKHRDLTRDNWSGTRRIASVDHLSGLYDVHSDSQKSDIISGREAVVFSDEFYVLFVSNAKIFNVSGAHSDIGAQLPAFGVLHDLDLVSTCPELVETGYQKPGGEQGIDANTYDGENFYSKFPSVTIGTLFYLLPDTVRKRLRTFRLSRPTLRGCCYGCRVASGDGRLDDIYFRDSCSMQIPRPKRGRLLALRVIVYSLPPLITVNNLRRSGAVGTGAMGCVASAASISSPMAPSPIHNAQRLRWRHLEGFMSTAEIVMGDV